MSDPQAALTVDETVVRQRLAGLRERIVAAGGDAAKVRVVAVTKGQPAAVVPVALAAGLMDLGENYAQELVAKTEALHLAPSAAGRPRWHFIGQLQTRKVRLLAPHVALWQSVDRTELVAELARRAPAARVLIQVNTTAEPAKGGCEPGALAELLELAAQAGLSVEGLMTVGPTDPDTDPRPGFELVRALVDRFGLASCSMGMSEDLEAAVHCGSTMVRVGTALFGPRMRR